VDDNPLAIKRVRGYVYGTYAILEELGCGFYLSFDTVPELKPQVFSFVGWELCDAPLRIGLSSKHNPRTVLRYGQPRWIGHIRGWHGLRRLLRSEYKLCFGAAHGMRSKRC